MDRVCVSGASCRTHRDVTEISYGLARREGKRLGLTVWGLRRAAGRAAVSAGIASSGSTWQPVSSQAAAAAAAAESRVCPRTLAELMREKFSLANDREDMRGEARWRLREVI